MKKIFLTLITCTILFGCSKNEENTNPVSVNKNKMKENLKGSWKLVGYYDDIDNDPVTGTNLHLYDVLSITTFNSDGTFIEVANSNSFYGNYIISDDSVLTKNYTLNPNFDTTQKVYIVNDSVFNTEIYPYPEGGLGFMSRYEKVVTP